MSLLLDIEKRNAVLATMANLVGRESETLLAANAKDMAGFADGDIAMMKICAKIRFSMAFLSAEA